MSSPTPSPPRRRGLGLRSRLALMLVAGLLPGMAATGWLLGRDQAARLDLTETALQGMAQRLAEGQAALHDKTAAVLAALGRMPEVRAGLLDPRACAETLAEVVSEAPWLRAIAAIAPDGTRICSSAPGDGAVSVSDRAYFRQALEGGGPVVSDLVTGRVLQVPQFILAQPVADEAGGVERVMLGVLDLDAVAGLVARAAPGEQVLVLDGTGHVASAHPQGASMPGMDLSSHPAVAAALRGTGGSLRAPGTTTPEATLHSFARIPGTGAAVLVSRPEGAVLAPLRAERRVVEFGFAIGLLISLSLAWWAARALVLRGLDRITRVAAAAGEESDRGVRQGRIAEAAPDRWAATELHALHGALSGLEARQEAALARARRAEAEARAAAAALEDSRNALAGRKARLRSILDTALDAIVVLDDAGRIHEVNRAAERIFGWTAEELVGQSAGRLMREADAAAHDRQVAAHARGGRGHAVGMRREVTGLHRDGASVPLEVSVSSWDDAEGRRFYTAVMRDVTESRAQAEALAAGEARSRAQAGLLQGVLETMEQGVIAIDGEGRLVAANQRLAEFLDVPQQLRQPGLHFTEMAEVLARRGDYGPGEPRALAEARYAALVAQPQQRFTRAAPGGRVLDVATVPMAGGGILATYSDVTERAAREAALEAAEAQARAQAGLLDVVNGSMEQGLAAWDADGHLLVANRRYLEMLDLPADLVVPGRHYTQVGLFIARRGEYGPGDPEELARTRYERARRGDGHRLLRTRPNGRSIEVMGRSLPGGGFVTTFTDVTERLAAERRLAASEAEFRLLAEAAGDVVMRARLDGTATYVSPAAERVLGWTAEGLLGRRLLDFGHPEDVAWAEAQLEPLSLGRAEDATVTWRFRRPAGDHLWVELRARLIRPEDGGAPEECVIALRDANDRKAAEEALIAAQERLERMATTDALTSLANRGSFDDRLRGEWRRAAREGTALSVLLLDADRFKLFNDTYGHAEGDACLKAIATAMEAVARRPGDLPARYGGEEFAMILPNTDEDGAAHVAEELRARVQAAGLPHAANPPHGVVTISIGAATARPLPDDDLPATDALLRRADARLYLAKASGRNRLGPPADPPIPVAAE